MLVERKRGGIDGVEVLADEIVLVVGEIEHELGEADLVGVLSIGVVLEGFLENGICGAEVVIGIVVGILSGIAEVEDFFVRARDEDGRTVDGGLFDGLVELDEPDDEPDNQADKSETTNDAEYDDENFASLAGFLLALFGFFALLCKGVLGLGSFDADVLGLELHGFRRGLGWSFRGGIGRL